MECYVLEGSVQPRDLGPKVGEHRLPVFSTDKEGPGITHQAVNVMNQFMRRSHSRSGTKRGKGFRRAAQRFLQAVSEGGQEMSQ